MIVTQEVCVAYVMLVHCDVMVLSPHLVTNDHKAFKHASVFCARYSGLNTMSGNIFVIILA